MSLNIQEICRKLELTDRRSKISTMEYLKQKCLKTENCTDAEILKIYNECYLHLLKCYSDRFESVRDQAVQTVDIFMERLPPNDFHLLNIVASLAERMGQQETLEESEEIRLIFIQQLFKLEIRFVQSGNKRPLQDCYADLLRILVKALRDPYPAVQREACACCIVLVSSAEPYVFQSYAEPLAKGLYGMLNHKHSQARISAVKALGHVALHVDASGDSLSRLIMEVSPLLMDSMALVRRECGELGVRLLLELRDRYSYFERLIPFVLCCLKDDSPEVRDYIFPLWEKCGKQYYDENETELSKQEIADILPVNYPANVKRPSIGCRAIVQRSLRLLKLIMRESSDWKENVRLHSLKLLYQFVLHAESAMTASFFEIYADVARALRDSGTIVVQEAFKVADLMGRLLNYDDWYEHGFEGLERNAKEGYLKCFYYMYTPALGVKLEHNLRLSQMLVQPEFSQTLKCDFQLYILKMVATILEKTKGENKESTCHLKYDDVYNEIYKNCYCSTIKVMALSVESDQSNSEALQTMGSNLINQIATRCKCSLDDIHEKYFSYALEYFADIDVLLDALSEPILLLYGLLKLAKFRQPYLSQLQKKINIVFEQCADESKIKIFSSVSIAMLDWSSTIRRSLDESCTLLKQFVCSVVEPHLIWKAGSNAEAMRSIAIATLCSLSQGASEEAVHVLPDLAKYIPHLLEDQAVATRHYALKCLYNFGEVDIEYLKPIAYACLQRFDDPSSGIRVLAAAVIPKLKPKLKENITNDDAESKSTLFDSDVWLAFIKYCMDVMFLHYDGPEKRLQTVIKETIIQLTERYPAISKDSYYRTLSTTHNCFNLQELKSELAFTE